MPQISGLGHVGLYCNDLGTMRDFYAHYELALVRAKDAAQKTHNVQQVSFKVTRLDDVRAFYHRFLAAGVQIDRTVTHGIACSVYFYDPEDDRIELYYTTPYKIRQPLGEPIDLDRPDSELLAFAKLFEETTGPPRGAQQPVGR